VKFLAPAGNRTTISRASISCCIYCTDEAIPPPHSYKESAPWKFFWIDLNTDNTIILLATSYGYTHKGTAMACRHTQNTTCYYIRLCIQPTVWKCVRCIGLTMQQYDCTVLLKTVAVQELSWMSWTIRWNMHHDFRISQVNGPQYFA